MNIMSNIPNMLTLLRALGALSLLFLAPDSLPFYAVYTLAGATDVLDGWIARATRSTSRLGAKLDSAADLLFYGMMLIRMFPLLRAEMPAWTWALAGLAAAVRLCAYIAAAVKYRCFPALHTFLNKLSGFMVFMIPYFMLLTWAVPCCAAVCLVTLAASAQELAIHLRRSPNGGKAPGGTEENI